MIKHLILFSLLCFALVPTQSFSQLKHQFGVIAPFEAQLKECSFDPEATAVVLLDEAFSTYDDEYQLITQTHRRLKILSDKGIDNANVSISFYSDDNFELIDKIEARTINIENGNRQEYPVEQKNIYLKKRNEYYSEYRFAFPQVKAGSIIEYSYRSTKKNYNGLKGWHFQTQLPVYISSYEVIPSPNIEFTYRVQKNQSYPIIIKPSKLTNSIYFEMDSLPALDEEPFMDSRENYVQKVIFTITKFVGLAGVQKYMDSWDDVARKLWGRSEFGGEIRANLREPQAMVAAATEGKTPFEKARYIHDFVRKNVQWNGLYSFAAGDGVRPAWNKRSGNSGCINLLLVNLLRNAGLEVYPLLVSERGNGKVNKETPFLSQFNNVYALVIIDGKKYYLDATDIYTPARMIPYSILNTTALIVRHKTGELIDIEEPEVKYLENIYINAELSDNGTLSATVQESGKDYARVEQVSNYIKDKEKYVDNYIKEGLVNVDIDSLKISGEDNDSVAFVQRFKMKTQIQHTGDYAFLDLNFFTGFTTSPFISNKRFSNINFGYKTSISLNWTVKLPETLTIDALPKSMRMVNADKSASFSRELVYNENISRLSARIKIDLNKSLYSVSEYYELKEFFKKMVNMLNEQVAFKSK